MLERTVPKNVHDPYLYQSPRISVDIAFRCLDRRPSQHRPHDRQILHAYIWPETPNGISIPLHYGSYVCIRSHVHFTPQAAGNTAPRDSIKFTLPNMVELTVASIGFLYSRSIKS